MLVSPWATRVGGSSLGRRRRCRRRWEASLAAAGRPWRPPPAMANDFRWRPNFVCDGFHGVRSFFFVFFTCKSWSVMSIELKSDFHSTVDWGSHSTGQSSKSGSHLDDSHQKHFRIHLGITWFNNITSSRPFLSLLGTLKNNSKRYELELIPYHMKLCSIFFEDGWSHGLGPTFSFSFWNHF